MDDGIGRLLSYWFGPEREEEPARERRFRRWFTADKATDAEIAERFGEDAVRAARGELDHWRESAEGRLALILLCDQVPRHMHRGRAAAFEQDGKALELALEGIEAGADRELPVLQRAFFYMPLQHAEAADMQERSVRLYDALLADAPEPLHGVIESFAAYARLHRDIVARFSRFPHRNRALGREDTAEERAYLRDGGPSFGQ